MAAATAEKTKVENKPVPQETENLAVLIEKNLTIDPATGNGTIPKNVYDALLDAQDVTRAEVEKVATAHANIAAALTLAHRVGVPVFKKNKELDRITTSLPATGRDKFETVFDRSSMVPDRQPDGSMAQREKFGSIRTSFNSFGTRNAGQMKTIKDLLCEQATAALSGKK